MTQDDVTRGGSVHDEMVRGRESQSYTTSCSSMPQRDGTRKTDERVAQMSVLELDCSPQLIDHSLRRNRHGIAINININTMSSLLFV